MEQNRKSWWLRPLAWGFVIIGVLAMQFAGYLLCLVGEWSMAQIKDLSAILVMLVLAVFGGVYFSLAYFALFLIPGLTVEYSNRIYPSKKAARYYVIGIYELIGCAFLIYAGTRGIARASSMFWYYARFSFVGLSTIVMIVSGKGEAKEYKTVEEKQKIVPTWVLICVAVMLITAFAVLYSGMSSKIETEREEAYKEGYEEGYDSGYDSGITDGEYKLKTYKSKNNSPDGNSVKEISVYVKNQYGITPSEAAEIVCKYNNPDGSGYPTWAVYQNALLALVYAGGLIGY